MVFTFYHLLNMCYEWCKSWELLCDRSVVKINLLSCFFERLRQSLLGEPPRLWVYRSLRFKLNRRTFEGGDGSSLTPCSTSVLGLWPCKRCRCRDHRISSKQKGHSSRNLWSLGPHACRITHHYAGSGPSIAFSQLHKNRLTCMLNCRVA